LYHPANSSFHAILSYEASLTGGKMKAVLLYHRPEKAIESRAHNLDERKADELVSSLRADGLEAYQIDQEAKHRGKAGKCAECQKEGEEYIRNHLPAVPAFSTLDIDEKPQITEPLSLGSSLISSQLQPDEGIRYSLVSLLSSLRFKLPLIAGVVLFLLAMVFLIRRFDPVSGKPAAVVLPTNTNTQPAVEIILSPTPIPQTPTRAPTSTEMPTPAPTSTITPTERPACLNALDVTVENIGETICVEGTVTKAYFQEPAFYIIFGNASDAFYMFSYDRRFDSLVPGDCVRITGKIQSLKNDPIIVITARDILETCP